MRRVRFMIGLLAALVIPSVGQAQIISITIAPPELPVYEQPPLPAPGYIWTPGYWAYGPDGYYWVPGTWVEPPAVGLLWTPGYWGWRNGVYAWSDGYWGPRVGFYGGVNYGFGYGGVGYEGGHWDNGVLAYNRTVNNFGSVTVTNVYNKTVINNNITRVSFNGGTGGVTAQPTPQSRLLRKITTLLLRPRRPSSNILRARTERCSPPRTTAARQSLRQPSRASSPARAS